MRTAQKRGTDLGCAAIDQTDVPRLAEIPGVVPSLREEIRGCAFAPRCAFAVERCRRAAPPLEEKNPGHYAACFESARLAA
jgi:peptide/nickel transport system ATP-binding protein